MIARLLGEEGLDVEILAFNQLSFDCWEETLPAYILPWLFPSYSIIIVNVKKSFGRERKPHASGCKTISNF